MSRAWLRFVVSCHLCRGAARRPGVAAPVPRPPTLTAACSQEAFMENYFASQRHTIFRNVAVLIYVFDVESRELEKDFHYFQSCLSSIAEVGR